MSDERERRLKALRERVQAKKLEPAQPDTLEELVVTTEDLSDGNQVADEDEWYAMIDRDADRWRNLAATLIFIGSMLGLLSGALILQGNPSELLNTSLFAEEETVDISGSALRMSRGMEWKTSRSSCSS